MVRLSAYAVVAVVLLRLLCGWHFYNEGVKKLDPSFSSAGFLRGATGPLAPLFRSMAPGPYGAYGEFLQPHEIGDDEQRTAAIDAWVADYGSKAAAAVKSGEPLPTEIAPVAPGADIVARMSASWDKGLVRVSRLGASDETIEQLKAAKEAKLGDLAFYLHSQSDGIRDLQHECWRLVELRRDAGGSPAPFQTKLVADKQGETWATIQPWVRAITSIEDEFIAEAAAITEADGVTRTRVEPALRERTLLGWIDIAVMAAVLGSGVCVFLGCFTRVASLVAAGFLVSLMLTQPLGYGVEFKEFIFWAIEIAAFLVLAAVGAGRWAGVDGVIEALGARFNRESLTQTVPNQPAATTVA